MEFQNIRLMRAKLPDLNAGTYTVHVEQEVQEPVERTLQSADSVFHVSARRFGMEPGIIHSVYPPADSTGCYKDTLPHIVCCQAAFPWLRRMYSGQKEDTTPFVALVCLAEGEDFQEGQASIGELVKRGGAGAYFPSYDLDGAAGEKPEDMCRFVDIDAALCAEILPREEELGCLVHVRAASLYDKADSLISQDGSFSVVVCNRFPESPAGETRRNYVFLVSMENYHGHLPEGEHFAEVTAGKKARFIVLHKWAFESEAGDTPGFSHIMKNLDTGTLALPNTGKENEASKLAERGYVPLMHLTRTGEKTVSFYRSPLVPFRTEVIPHGESHTADGEIRYDPAWGMFDMTYAAAWQIGRFMALADKEIARQIYLWRRGVVAEMFKSRARAQMSAGFQRCLAAGQERENVPQSFLGYLAQADSVLALLKREENMGDRNGLMRAGLEWMRDAPARERIMEEWRTGREE